MSRRGDAMSWRRVAKSAQASAAHGLLFTFTLFLVLKLDHAFSCSWWLVFCPLWLFHAVVSRGRFSLPAPSVPHGRHWAPCHAVVATPLLTAFELLLCAHLESSHAVNLKIAFLPLMILEAVILIDNIRMCRALMPGDEESLSDDVIWEILPAKLDGPRTLPVFMWAGYQHFWIAISMVFLIAATLFMVLKLCGDISGLGWWDLFINFSIGQCFAFLVCTKWSNPIIHRRSETRESGPSSVEVGYLDWNSGLVVHPEEDQSHGRMCCLQDVGGHVMKVLIIGFQVLLCMYLEGTPAGARKMTVPVIFSPLLLLQGTGVLFSTLQLVERIVLLLHNETAHGQYFMFSSRTRDSLEFMLRGSRLLGWWSIDEASGEEQARLFREGPSGYNTFSSYPPEVVKKMPKKELAEEVWRLQAALGEQTQITKITQQEYERLQHEKVICRVCFEREISVVLLPCRHRILCSSCCGKCKKCPVCRVSVDELLPVYDV